jgi:hypothetical protein
MSLGTDWFYRDNPESERKRKNMAKLLCQLHLGVLAALALSWVDAAHAQSKDANPPAATSAAPAPAIDGFRGAKFGMTETEARRAIVSDFKIAPKSIVQSQNQLQHTDVLTVQVPNMVPDGGIASVSYVFGYHTHKLIEVNILWSPEIDPKTTPAMLYQNGESLQQYFANEGFPADRSTGNIATPNGILLFRGSDASGNAVLLMLSGTIAKDQKTEKSVLTPASLTLAYAADPAHPDVFQLAKGSF